MHKKLNLHIYLFSAVELLQNPDLVPQRLKTKHDKATKRVTVDSRNEVYFKQFVKPNLNKIVS